MPVLENPHAGTGSVVLDIGGDIGALIVTMPAAMDEMEVEIVPTGTASHATGQAQPGRHSHTGDHDHDHDHDHSGDHHQLAPPHVAVVPRPTPDGSIIHSLVFGQLQEGIYDLYVRPAGPVELTAVVIGGRITEAVWPQETRSS